MKNKLMGALVALPVLATTALAQTGTTVDVSTISDQIDAAQGHAVTIGGAGLGLLGFFVIYKLVRRAANRLV